MPESLKLKVTIATLDEAPKPLHAFYGKGEDGAFHLQLDGDHPDSLRLAEFRENNRALNTQKVELEAKLAAFDGIDPVAAKEALGKPDLTRKAGELETALAAERAAHAKTAFKTAIAFEFLKGGGRPEAVDFAVAVAEKTYAMKDGVLTTAVFSAKDPGVRLPVAEWVAQQMTTNAFLFLPSRGGGADPLKGNGGPPRVTVDRHDALAVGRHLEQIADGTMVVE